MLAHCSAALDMALGRINPPRVLIGRLIGSLVKPIYTNEKPISRNSPTHKKLLVSDQRDFLREQEQLKLRLRQFHQAGEVQCTRHPHPFFGTLSPEDWSRGIYKHMSHHLRQFGACPPSSLAERRQLHQIILRHRLKMPSGLPPRRQTAHDHERVKSFFPQ
jgi:hypothetical protein